MNSETKNLAQSLKTILEENEGEFGYWGEEIKLDPLPQEESSSKPAMGFKPPASAPAMKRTPAPSAPVQKAYEVPRNRTIDIPVKGTKADKLKYLNEEVIGDCKLCPLSETRIKLVFGVGNPEGDVMFIGEGPGFDEDRQGEPFVGKAGQLLDKIIGAIGLNRQNSYIANIVKCHPLKNPKRPEMRGNDRPPTPKEAATCDPFLKKQIEIIDPKIIVTLGAPATKAILNTFEGITSLRGKITERKLIEGKPPYKILPTFHPSAVLRNEELKRPVWEDMKLLRKFLQGEGPKA